MKDAATAYRRFCNDYIKLCYVNHAIISRSLCWMDVKLEKITKLENEICWLFFYLFLTMKTVQLVLYNSASTPFNGTFFTQSKSNKLLSW